MRPFPGWRMELHRDDSAFISAPPLPSSSLRCACPQQRVSYARRTCAERCFSTDVRGYRQRRSQLQEVRPSCSMWPSSGATGTRQRSALHIITSRLAGQSR